jgi:hypothetical protein
LVTLAIVESAAWMAVVGMEALAFKRHEIKVVDLVLASGMVLVWVSPQNVRWPHRLSGLAIPLRPPLRSTSSYPCVVSNSGLSGVMDDLRRHNIVCRVPTNCTWIVSPMG